MQTPLIPLPTSLTEKVWEKRGKKIVSCLVPRPTVIGCFAKDGAEKTKNLFCGAKSMGIFIRRIQ